MSSIRKKFGIQFFVTNSATITYFFMSLILSRLLSPSEVGIFSITAVLVGFTHVFRDFGVVSFIRRQKVLSDDLLRASIGVLFTSSWVVAVLLYASADYVAIYFKQPGIRNIMHVQAIGFLIIPFGSIPQAVLARGLEVEKTAIVTVISVIVYATTCITLAYLGFSFMSMAWANLLNIIVSSVGFMWLSPKGLPRTPSFKGWKGVVHFGAGAMITSALRATDAALPDILLGKISGPHDVGIFSRGNSTVNIFNNVAGPTVNFFALPYLAKIHHGGDKVSKEVARSIAYLSGLMWPALVVMAVMAKSVVVLLYGAKWEESAIIIPWLCVCAALQIGFLVLQPALTALNKPYMSAFPIALIVIAKVVLGIWSFDGGNLVSFARAVAIAEILAIPINLYLLDRYVGLKFSAWIKAVSQSLQLCIVVLVQVLLLKWVIQSIEMPLLRITLTALWITPSWICAIFLLNHPLKEEMLTARNFIKSYFVPKAKKL
ncbi:oligosaccharide flippase family protein [Undibacterium sp. TJN25]|uniref:oligosaccharide flippase family protein n=1 Tax=Undibacterium sp. TJN25 TaxID=3413056 RepID=UPI003BF3367B